MFKITNEWLDANKTIKGGWTREQVNVLGLSWPLRKNWKKGVIGNFILQSDRIKFENAANITCKSKKQELSVFQLTMKINILERENRKLRFIIDEGLGPKDLDRDI